MHLNELWISDEAVERVSVSGPALELRLTWRWEELPLLLALPNQLTLRWDHIHHDDPHAGIPVELVGWDTACSAAPLVAVTVRLERDVQGTRSG